MAMSLSRTSCSFATAPETADGADCADTPGTCGLGRATVCGVGEVCGRAGTGAVAATAWARFDGGPWSTMRSVRLTTSVLAAGSPETLDIQAAYWPWSAMRSDSF